ncbi:hypothetical protein ACQYWQ_24210 [Streptomyces sp. P6-2-1]|uniref:hypothetical protein n=1 Tax=Streptomyces sp. P6-2-1 TaxID=3422591 RepID=UPI003D35ED99
MPLTPATVRPVPDARLGGRPEGRALLSGLPALLSWRGSPLRTRHAEPTDASPPGVAVREVCEETGPRPEWPCLTPYALDAPFAIGVRAIGARPGKGEPAHAPGDFRFLLCPAEESAPTLALQEEEVTGATRLPFPEARSPAHHAEPLVAADALDLDRRRLSPGPAGLSRRHADPARRGARP